MLCLRIVFASSLFADIHRLQSAFFAQLGVALLTLAVTVFSAKPSSSVESATQKVINTCFSIATFSGMISTFFAIIPALYASRNHTTRFNAADMFLRFGSAYVSICSILMAFTVAPTFVGLLLLVTSSIPIAVDSVIILLALPIMGLVSIATVFFWPMINPLSAIRWRHSAL